VVGGGDSACEEALFLTKYASTVHLVHRRGELRASRIMAARALAHPKVVPVFNAAPVGYRTDERGRLDTLHLVDTVTGLERDLAVRGVFMAIGHKPNTAFLHGSGVDLDDQGYIRVVHGCRTNLPGLFAAGDVRDHDYRQAVTAAGMGCMAALEAERHLTALGIGAHAAALSQGAAGGAAGGTLHASIH
jgi:thioredoxin reductase (NADPH)